MNKPSLPPEDLPPAEATSTDRILCQQLEESTTKHFYEACDRATQALMTNDQ